MNKASLRLFKSILIDNDSQEQYNNQAFYDRMLSKGYFVSPYILCYPSLLSEIERIIGVSATEANSTFYKSWKSISDKSEQKLRLDQFLHYLLGYTPNEIVNIPNSFGKIVYIQAITEDELTRKLKVLCNSGIAMSDTTINDILELIRLYNIKITSSSNKELNMRLCDLRREVPQEPTEFLRYLVYKKINSTLLIKSQDTIKAISSSYVNIDCYLPSAPLNLASIFYRYKDLFLALKKKSGNKTFFNRLRRKAPIQHIPMEQGYVDSVTKNVRNGTLDPQKLNKSLQNLTFFRKARLAQTLINNIYHEGVSLYLIRNGKSWVRDRDKYQGDFKTPFNIVVKSMLKDLSGVTYYIPDYVHYTLPTSEKKFFGSIPFGTVFSVYGPLVAGIYWKDVSTDLDLSVLVNDGKFGWNGEYKGEGILFSGDVVAPSLDGATELFRFSSFPNPALLVANIYGSQLNDVPYKFMLGTTGVPLTKSYMLQPSEILHSESSSISKGKSLALGFVHKNTFTLTSFTISRSNVSSPDENTTKMINYFMSQKKISLNNFLEQCGATIVNKPTEGAIDLSPESLDKNTFINILT